VGGIFICSFRVSSAEWLFTACTIDIYAQISEHRYLRSVVRGKVSHFLQCPDLPL
jgi:hypothetical protein